MNVRELVGKEVVGEQGSRIGKVRDVEIDTATWQVKAVEVELAKNIAEEFGMKRMLGSSYIPIKIDDVKSVADIVLLKIPKSQLKAAIESERAATEALQEA